MNKDEKIAAITEEEVLSRLYYNKGVSLVKALEQIAQTLDDAFDDYPPSPEQRFTIQQIRHLAMKVKDQFQGIENYGCYKSPNIFEVNK